MNTRKANVKTVKAPQGSKNSPVTVGSQLYEKIKTDIIFGRLQPGSKLKLQSLKSNYSVSLSILREVLSRLSSEGFVAAEEQRGFFVVPVSKKDFTEIANLRILIECSAVRASIKNGDADWEGGLVSAHHKLHLVERRIISGEEFDKVLWKNCDSSFHRAMIQACDSINILALHDIIYNKYLRYQMLVLTNRGKVAVDEHKQMLDSALARDSAKTEKVLEQHIRLGLEHALPMLK